MNKNRVLVFGMMLALLGLVWVQVHLLTQVANQSSTTFDRNVKVAMQSVSDAFVLDYLRVGVDEYVDSSDNGNRRVLIEVYDKSNTETFHNYNVDRRVTVKTNATSDSIFQYEEELSNDGIEARQWASALVEEMLEQRNQKELDEKVMEFDFDSVIAAQLSRFDLPSEYDFIVTDKDGKLLRSTTTDSSSGNWYAGSFSNGLLQSAGNIRLRLPGKRFSVFKDISIPLVMSALFVLLTAGLFLAVFGLYKREKEVSEARDDFINSMSHELKTPLATIALSLENIGTGQKDDQRYVSVIREENKRMQYYVENILQLARMDKTEFELHKKRESLRALIEDVVRSEQIRAEIKGGRIELEANGRVELEMDGMHIRNVLHNLIDNAIKYSDGAPLVSVTVTDRGDVVEVEVSDKGIGIESGELDRIFEKFHRVNHGDIYRVKGTGIGLSYARMIIEQHGGSLSAESSPGKGSTFKIQLPIGEK